MCIQFWDLYLFKLGKMLQKAGYRRRKQGWFKKIDVEDMVLHNSLKLSKEYEFLHIFRYTVALLDGVIILDFT